MNDSLKQLLKETDSRAAVTSSLPSADLTERVLRTNKQIKSRQLVATVGLILVGLFSVAITFRNTASRRSNTNARDMRPPAPNIALNNEPDHQIEQIQLMATQHEAMAAILIASEKTRNLESELARLQRLPTDDDFAERAASAVVFQADRLLQTPQTQPAAVRAYNDVINHFPGTVSASIARERIAQIEKQG